MTIPATVFNIVSHWREQKTQNQSKPFSLTNSQVRPRGQTLYFT